MRMQFASRCTRIKLLILTMLVTFGFTVSCAANSLPGPVTSELEPHPSLPENSVPTGASESGSSYNWRRSKLSLNDTPAVASVGEERLQALPALTPGIDWENGTGKSYLIPAGNVFGFLVGLQLFDRTVLGHEREANGQKTYDVDFSTFLDNMGKQNWVFDKDTFGVNQFGHPYEGSMMYGLARSTGLDFWPSLAYSNVGSFLWEMGGENTRPSVNDLITTGNAGSLLGEALFRMSQLVLNEGGSHPDAWHEFGAALLSPGTGFNRWAYGERFKTVFPSHAPATYWRVRLGASLTGISDQNAALDFQMSYGLPGKAGYSYRRPFDNFDFEIGGLSRAGNTLGILLLRGLLYGKDYQKGEDFRGVWGLYGSYDYISPAKFRVSSTALSLGTTGQYWMTNNLALQGTLLGGVGFGAGGNIPTPTGLRDYHYGVTPQALLSLRLLIGDRASCEVGARGYYISGMGSDNTTGSEEIIRFTSGFTFRVYGRHGVGLQFVESIRNAQYGRQPASHQQDGTISLVYTFLGDSHMGAVEWGDPNSR